MLSAKVPYFILDLLQHTPSVYVEGLGRFEAIFHPAVVEMPEARIKPPYVEPDFKFEQETPSELLPKFIAYAAGTQQGIAHGAVVAFVRRVFENTENGMVYPIEKFGTFTRSAIDHIRFTPDWDAFNLSFSGLEVLDISTPIEMPRESQAYFAPPAPPPPPIVETWSSPIVTEPVATRDYDAEDIPTESKETVSSETIEETEAKQEGIDQTTSRLWWIILTTALILITILCAYLAWDIISNRKQLNEYNANKQNTIVTTPSQDSLNTGDTANAPIVTNTETEVPVSTPEPVVTPPVKTPETSNPCFVVVGAFSEQENITRMVDRLNELGYTSEQIKGGSLTRVAIRTDCDPSNLNTVLNDARAKINPEAWIY